MSTQSSGGDVLPGFSDLRAAQLRAVRVDDGDNPMLVGYQPPSGPPQAVPGDQFYPHFLTPVDLFGPQLYADDAALALSNPAAIANFTTLASIDVRGAKSIRFDFLFTVVTNSQIAWVVEAQLQGSNPKLTTERWVPLGVVDSTLTAPGAADDLAFRLAYGSELRTPVFTSGGTKSLSLDYDVFTKDVIRVRMADVGNLQVPQSTVFAAYTLAR